MSIRQVVWRALAVLILALLVSGCAPNFATSTGAATNTTDPSPISSTAQGTIIDEGPGPNSVVLKDTSPGQLSLFVNLMIGGYDASTRESANLNVVFSYQGRTVQFVKGEHVACNGIPVPGYGSNFNVTVPSAMLSGRLVTCTYTSGKTSATFRFTAPLAPAILSPQEHAQVSRGKSTPVSYRISQDWPFYVIALGPNTKAWTPTASSQPDPVMLDTSAFQAGPGSLALIQYFTLSDLRGPGFHSMQGTGNAVYEMQVTWV